MEFSSCRIIVKLYFVINEYIFFLLFNIQSEKLIEEQKRILTIFPHGVIIRSWNNLSDGKTIFSNQEFDAQIVKIRNKFREFDDVKVQCAVSDIDDSKFIETTLLKFLQSHQHQLEDCEIVQQSKVSIWCKDSSQSWRMLDDNSEDNSTQKIFSVKSMKVAWDDIQCFMHVFIDTTDLIKLEEARNNIRWQKIMFTNASHEFRTPLNAISNSFQIISINLK